MKQQMASSAYHLKPEEWGVAVLVSNSRQPLTALFSLVVGLPEAVSKTRGPGIVPRPL